MSTFMANASTVERKWYIVDAADKTLGRLAADIAVLLTGKHKVDYTKHVDCGDHVIVVNAETVSYTHLLLGASPNRQLPGEPQSPFIPPPPMQLYTAAQKSETLLIPMSPSDTLLDSGARRGIAVLRIARVPP